MSAAQTLVSRLEALQCHFTWDLDFSRSLLLRCRDNLIDIGSENGNKWLGHIYNLRGFIQYKLGSNEDAQSFFNKATEAFSQIKNTDEGPWLVVNYGNLAWLHHHLGDQVESEAYLSKVNALNKKYPSPSQEELHPEIYAEKAYTLMTFNGDINLVAVYFQRAIEMQPDRVEWNSWHVLALLYASNYSSRSTGLEDDIFQKMRIAQEQDPENLYLAAHYLCQRAQRGENVKDEARELATKVLRSPVSSYSGLKSLLWFYKTYISDDEDIDLAEEALKNHPDERYLKRRAALCYEKRILFSKSPPTKSMIARAVSLHQEVIALYPDSSLMRKIHLATIYALSHDEQAKAERIYQELLKSDLELAGQQVLFNSYAKYLHFQKQNEKMSIQYHMKAAKIQHQSFSRKDSIKVLQKIRDKGRDRMCGEIRNFLANLQEP
ncbi:Interferon-induced protein with tetratricopeptide repeats 1 [Dissostichus eleginoides]|uniref:Interferon-induced protein with tetratricopeptide repeats 1 n=1 Tax=Dissostichus eleginoides TaxID=100907 RepID=A0AAD9FF15_DISEL|nr:Interferon-induced protein with tetratricopeptide repeats 1 [Dissostichus eleginoides]